MSIDVSYRSISFSGLREETEHLTWGQRDIWNKIQNLGDLGRQFNLALDVDVPDGMSLDELSVALARVTGYHESLRTSFLVGPDGEPRQVLTSHGEIQVEVRTVERVDAETVALTREEMMRWEFDLDSIPLRLGILMDGKAPRSLIMCFSHLLCDGAGLQVLRRDLEVLLRSGELPRRTRDERIQPMDRTAFERSPRGQRLNDRALAYWHSQLERYPTRLFPPPSHPESVPRYRNGRLRSPVFPLATNLLARCHRTTPNSVGIALLALVLGSLSQSDRGVLHLICANRTLPGNKYAVAQLAQCSPVVIDVTHDSFESLFQHVYRQCIKAYRYSMYCPVEVARLVSETIPRSDDRRCLVNAMLDVFEETAPSDDVALASDDASLRSTAAISTFEWHGGTPHDDVTAYVRLGPSDTTVFQADTRVFPPDIIEKALHATLELLVEGSLDEKSPTDVVQRALSG
jgi:hypothetical protein